MMFNRYLTFSILLIAVMLTLSACGMNQTPEVDATPQGEIVSPSSAPIPSVEPSIVPSVDPSVTSPSLSEPPLLIETEYQLAPKEQEDFEIDFSSVYAEFTDAVRNKDISALDGFLDEEIKVSFGGEDGKDYFYEYWGLNENPEQSELWEVLDKIIALGGVYSFDAAEAETRRFVAPYIFADFQLDGFEHFVITDKSVKIYEQEDTASNVIGTVDYSILKQNFEGIPNETVLKFWEKTDLDFVSIQTLSGAEGYIQKQYVRSPLDYRFRFISYDGVEWKMDYLVAGD